MDCWAARPHLLSPFSGCVGSAWTEQLSLSPVDMIWQSSDPPLPLRCLQLPVGTRHSEDNYFLITKYIAERKQKNHHKN